LVASAQRSVNLYPELNPPSGTPPVPVTHYPTPGLLLVTTANNIEKVRTLYRATNGALFAVVGGSVYFISESYIWTLLGSIPYQLTPVSMTDNGLAVVLVDDTSTGYAIDMSDLRFGAITDPAFYGALKVDYLDTYFIFNRPGTPQFYISLSYATYDMLTGIQGEIYQGTLTAGGSGYTNGSYPAATLTGGSGSGATASVVVSGGSVISLSIASGGTGYANGDVLGISGIGGGSNFAYTVDFVHGQAFDPLDIAGKTGGADNIATLAAIHGELWLIGVLSSEIWANTGAADFTFGRIQGAFIDHGCVAPYSLSQQDVFLFWLSQDDQGKGVVVKTQGYSVERISTHAIERDIQSYPKIDDAIGYCYQQQGHAFYVLTFPSADKTWVYELGTGLWHERNSIDSNGNLLRHRSNCFAYAYGVELVGDYQNGRIYNMTPDVYTDNGVAIPRIRTFPHVVEDGKRLRYDRFVADMEVGQQPETVTSNPPQVMLRWSDTRGASYGNAIAQSMGSAGQFYTQPQWRRLGIARDRVFEMSWSAPAPTALNGAWIDVFEANT
jgi:hypothetical protein